MGASPGWWLVISRANRLPTYGRFRHVLAVFRWTGGRGGSERVGPTPNTTILPQTRHTRDIRWPRCATASACLFSTSELVDFVMDGPRGAFRALVIIGALAAASSTLRAQVPHSASLPKLHHVGLNSVDPARAIEWYLKVWPSAKRTEVAGFPGVAADMLVLFNKVSRPPAG